MLRRYDVSPMFRRMIMYFIWARGLGMIVIAIISTVLITVLDEDVGFGVGWGLPYAWGAVSIHFSLIFAKSELLSESVEWRTKLASVPGIVVAAAWPYIVPGLRSFRNGIKLENRVPSVTPNSKVQL